MSRYLLFDENIGSNRSAVYVILIAQCCDCRFAARPKSLDDFIVVHLSPPSTLIEAFTIKDGINASRFHFEHEYFSVSVERVVAF